MTDYSELVKALRIRSRNLCPGDICDICEAINFLCSDKVMHDAADAIEALQAQLPKQGEWIEDTTTYAGPGLSNYKCSLCGKICGTWRRGLEPSELPNWCGNCGADMRKMEAQE